MRIGIITQPLLDNYGGVLQNYALQQVLRRLKHDPRTIDRTLGRKRDRIKHVVRSLLNFRWPDLSHFPVRQKAIRRFVRHHIVTTYHVWRYRAEIVKMYGFETIIAGSDQIWRPKYNEYSLHDMFFRFVAELPVKKVVYAASFGTDEWEYTPELAEECKALVQKVDAVSVREESGVDLCRRHFGVDAQWVLDPTLLLDVKDYELLCDRIPHSTASYVAAYILDSEDHILERIKGIGDSLGLSVQFVFAEKRMSLSVEEWLAMFRDAKYVITDSFHGTIFSIIFKKPFISIGNRDRGMSRFYSLLKQFELEDRLSPDISTKTLLRPISWDKVNSRKNILKESSIRFLEDSLQIDV